MGYRELDRPRPHGFKLTVTTRGKAKVRPIPCPRCRVIVRDRYWHRDVGKGVCESCWRQLSPHDPMALR